MISILMCCPPDVWDIPQNLKDLYRTVWEISQKSIIDMAADRGSFICQSQSMNIHIQDPNFGKLTSMHFHAWKKGLKTGMYYLRSKAATDAIKFTVDKEKTKEPVKEELQPVAEGHAAVASSQQDAELLAQKQADMQCSLDDPDDCIACGS